MYIYMILLTSIYYKVWCSWNRTCNILQLLHCNSNGIWKNYSKDSFSRRNILSSIGWRCVTWPFDIRCNCKHIYSSSKKFWRTRSSYFDYIELKMNYRDLYDFLTFVISRYIYNIMLHIFVWFYDFNSVFDVMEHTAQLVSIKIWSLSEKYVWQALVL